MLHPDRPGKTARLMVGFLVLKQLENLNDERVIEAWVENPYFQSFAPSAHSPQHCQEPIRSQYFSLE